ncbi:MAG: KEOPS complex subunit Cgi121 [Candidatus Bathyarchaeia archaeon]
MYVQEFRKNCEIVGFRDVKVNETDAFLDAVDRDKPAGVEVQFFDADLIATWQHLYFAVLNALTAFKNRENLSKSVAMETLLYASGRRQIQKATQLLGIKPASRSMAVLIVGSKAEVVQEALAKVSRHVGGQLDDSVLGLSGEKVERVKRAFGISEAELETVMDGDGLEEALVDLVVERVALLATAR